jgi:adenine-specific DNA-methyltransferase
MGKSARFTDWSKEDLIAYITDLESRRKVGLVWDEDPARVASEADGGAGEAVLVEEVGRAISGQPTHVLIEGDNLHALTALQSTHQKSVDLIYIDPPYNRGMSVGNESRYNDRYVNSKWLAFMAERLALAKNLLKDTGVIFVSIDDNELAQLTLLMDEIFGEDNYKNTIIIRRGAKNVQAQFDTIDKLASGYEYVLFYARSAGQRFAKMVKELEQPKPGGWNNHWRGTERPTMRYELFGITPKSGQWRWSRERSLAAVANYELMLTETGQTSATVTQPEIDAWFLRKSEETGEEPDLLRLSKTGKPEHYVPPTDTTLLNDVWFDLPANSTNVLKSMFGRKVFDNPKPLGLIQRLCQFAGKDALILDFFAGSGTTTHAVLELNRKDGGARQVILVTNNENNICTEVCYPRLEMAIKGYTNAKGAGVDGLGGGLRYYRVEMAGD